ncbi:MAG: LysR substrate-binding domain-containing protein [Mesorhizobium sp.]|nr:LysR substrate-binding domain-containing protein [Mesorhizobium sp.]
MNGLKAVESVGRLGSLQRAADELGVSPGAVSQHLIRAERQLGRPVFARTPRGLVATQFGARLLARLSAGFGEIDAALALAEDDRDRALTVSVAPVLASKWLVPRLARFRAAHPDIRIRIDATVELADLDSSDIDLALRVGRGAWPGVRLKKLLRQEIFPVCAPTLAGQLRHPADVTNAPIVLDAGSPGSWDAWLAPFGLAESDLRPADSFTDAALCLDAAIAGQGVMLAWQTLAADALAAGLLVAPFPAAVDTGNAYYAVTSMARPDSPRVKSFVAWVEAEMAATAKAFA